MVLICSHGRDAVFNIVGNPRQMLFALWQLQLQRS